MDKKMTEKMNNICTKISKNELIIIRNNIVYYYPGELKGQELGSIHCYDDEYRLHLYNDLSLSSAMLKGISDLINKLNSEI